MRTAEEAKTITKYNHFILEEEERMVGRTACCEVISSARYTDTECWLSVNSFYRPMNWASKRKWVWLEILFTVVGLWKYLTLI